MEEELKEKIALARFKLISPILAEPGRAQNDYFRTQADRVHDLPHYGVRTLSIATMKSWLKNYRNKGFDGLKPKKRSDAGRPRRLDDTVLKAIEVKCKAYPSSAIQRLYDDLLQQGLLGHPPVHYNTLLRTIKENSWLPPKGRTDMRKAFEMEHVNDLWLCDFMHGPHLPAKSSSKAILCAIIDDHSRLIVGHAFNSSETIASLSLVVKEAFETYGIPKRLYVDNGPGFSSEFLAKTCALAGVSLIHSKPYDSPSRGKIERFFSTVRQRFLSGLQTVHNIEELNEAFHLWLHHDYHHKKHSGIGQTPVERYNQSLQSVHIHRLSKSELNEIFLIRHERVVNNDATISFKGDIYEVPPAYIRQRIELRHSVDDPTTLYLYDNGIRVGRVRLVNKKENARTFTPHRVTTTLSFHKEEVKP